MGPNARVMFWHKATNRMMITERSLSGRSGRARFCGFRRLGRGWPRLCKNASFRV